MVSLVIIDRLDERLVGCQPNPNPLKVNAAEIKIEFLNIFRV